MMDSFIKTAAETAKENGVVLCDCYDKWKQLDQIGIDTNLLLANRINHPTREMHHLFAESLFDIIFWR